MKSTPKPLLLLEDLLDQREGYRFSSQVHTAPGSSYLPILRETKQRQHYTTHKEVGILPGTILGVYNPTPNYVFVPACSYVEPFRRTRHGVMCQPGGRVELKNTDPEGAWHPYRYDNAREQVGGIVCSNGELLWLECFDHRLTWMAMADPIPEGLIEGTQFESEIWGTSLCAACGALRVPYRLHEVFTHHSKDQHDYRVCTLSGDKHEGELVTLNGKLLHLILRKV